MIEEAVRAMNMWAGSEESRNNIMAGMSEEGLEDGTVINHAEIASSTLSFL